MGMRVIVVLLTVVAMAAAQTTHPSTSTTTHPAATRRAFDPSTPKGALKLFASALRDGDAALLQEVVLTGNPSEARLVNAMANMAGALMDLHHAAARAFGDDGAAQFTDDTSAKFAETVARIDAAEITIEADKATVRYADARDVTYEMRKVGPAWKVPIADFLKGADAAATEQRLADLATQTQIIRDLTTEIAADKYKNTDAALNAWKSKIIAGPSHRPATVPATKPR